jgi:hypothetical protein
LATFVPCWACCKGTGARYARPDPLLLFPRCPPTFWELYNGEKSIGVSVHRIDAQLDHGALVARSEVPILEGDDPRLLMERCREVDSRLVVDVVRALARGSVKEIPVDTQREAGCTRCPPGASSERLNGAWGKGCGTTTSDGEPCRIPHGGRSRVREIPNGSLAEDRNVLERCI